MDIPQVVEHIDAPLSLIAFFPMVGALLAYLIGKTNKDYSGWIATLASATSFLFVVSFFSQLPEGAVLTDTVFKWIGVGNLTVDFKLTLDSLSAAMCLVVTGVGTLIHLYSIGYMAEDESRPRFFAYLNLFLFAMLLLVLGGNMLVLFVGWEGVGLCSYLLIGFWHKKTEYASAGRKAFVVNRIGDAGFLLGMFLLFLYFGSLDFEVLALKVPKYVGQNIVPLSICTLASLCLFVGATGKSAQIPLFVWLPDAMAGPTPVSALIHAATMVTAGVYMLARMHFLFSLSPQTLGIVVFIGCITAFIAATTALKQNDIKKVLAYSTVSQLGFMFMAAGAGAYWVALFHVITHAFFKACLFLGAGSVIHGCHHEQDMRHMGGLWKLMPITFATYLISTIAIAGVFPLAGYYSKHAIMGALDSAGYSFFFAPQVVLILATITALLTAFYMTRSVVMTFFGEYRGHAHPHESPWQMTVPLIVLAFLALFAGAYFASHGRLQNYLGSVLPLGDEHVSETIVASVIHSWPGFLGILAAVLFYLKWTNIPQFLQDRFPIFARLFEGKYFFDEIYSSWIIKPLENMAAFLWKVIDQGLVDFAVNGAARIVDIQGEVVRGTQSGEVRNYALLMFIGTVILLLFCFIL